MNKATLLLLLLVACNRGAATGRETPKEAAAPNPGSAVTRPTPTQADKEEVFKVGGDVKAPVMIERVEADLNQCSPPYVTSMVLLSATIDSEGRVRDAHLIKKGDPCFDILALEALKQSRFRPATLHGRPVTVEFNFVVRAEIRP